MPDGAVLVLKLDEQKARAWRQAMAPGTDFGRGLLLADAIAKGAGLGNGLPRGPLIHAYSARLIPGISWLWDDTRGRLILQSRSMAETTLPSNPAAFLPACPDPKGAALVFWRNVVEMAPGEVFAPNVYITPHPHAFDPVPGRCIAGWSLTPDAPATLAVPGRGIGAVNRDAKDGSTFGIRAIVSGRPVEGRVRVVDPLKHPITGTWRQVLEVPCGGVPQKPAAVIHELRFDGAQRFSLAWQPFGNQIDVAGRYTLDPETGAFSLTLESGNLQLGTETTGVARINQAGQLEMRGWHPGNKVQGSPRLCETVYEK